MFLDWGQLQDQYLQLSLYGSCGEEVWWYLKDWEPWRADLLLYLASQTWICSLQQSQGAQLCSQIDSTHHCSSQQSGRRLWWLQFPDFPPWCHSLRSSISQSPHQKSLRCRFTPLRSWKVAQSCQSWLERSDRLASKSYFWPQSWAFQGSSKALRRVTIRPARCRSRSRRKKTQA